MLSDPLLVVVRLARAFDDLGIRYLVGGSLASAIYGKPRATQDVNLVAEIAPADVEPLAGGLASEFYVNPAMIRDAIRRLACFNVVHLPTMFKADVFIARDDAWSREEMARARTEPIDTPDGPAAVRFASPEDVLLHKLVWYRLGGEVSDRQWGDIVGVIQVQGDSLDIAYLGSWAPVLGVSDLLARAWPEAAPGRRMHPTRAVATGNMTARPERDFRPTPSRHRPGRPRAGRPDGTDLTGPVPRG